MYADVQNYDYVPCIEGLATTIEELELDDMKGIGYTYKCMGAGQ